MLRNLIWGAAAAACAGCSADVPEEGALTGGPDAAGGGAAYVRDFGDYTVHYRAVMTTALAPEVREAYGLPEDSDDILLIVAIEDRALGDNVEAEVDAEAVNLTQQLVRIEMNEVHANQMTSYVGLVEVEDREVLDFTVRILPEDATQPIELEFRERFFTEPAPAAGVDAGAADASAAAQPVAPGARIGYHERPRRLSSSVVHGTLHHHRGDHRLGAAQARQSGRPDHGRGADRLRP